MNFFLPGDMEPERLRMALLTMLRAGIAGPPEVVESKPGC